MLRDFAGGTAASSESQLRDWLAQEPERRAWWGRFFSAGEPTFPALTSWLQAVAGADEWPEIAAAASAALPSWVDETLDDSDPGLIGRVWAVDLVATLFGQRLLKAGRGRTWGLFPHDPELPELTHRWAVVSRSGRGQADFMLVAHAAVDFASWVRRETLQPAFEHWEGGLRGAEIAPPASPAVPSPALEWSPIARGGYWQISVPNEAAHRQYGRVRDLVEWLQARTDVIEAYGEDRDRVNVRVRRLSPGLRREAEAHWHSTAPNA